MQAIAIAPWLAYTWAPRARWFVSMPAVSALNGSDSFIVLLFAVVAYFLIASIALALIAIPPLRVMASGWLRKLGMRVQSTGTATLSVAQHAAMGSRSAAAQSIDRCVQTWQRHRILIVAAMLVIITPPLVAWALRPHAGWTAYEESVGHDDTQVSWLLKGEQLVPPPPLPPEVFAQRDIVEERPELQTADRDWLLLDMQFRQRLLEVFRIMNTKYGYNMALLEGYRSPQRQQMLAAMGPNVTRAGAFQSRHQFGLAADCAFMRDGRLVISERDPWAMRGYELYGEVAESVGLTWGGRWKMMDFGHVELRRPGDLPSNS